MKKPKILLSFDVEEFDTPLEYGKQLPLEEQFEASRIGLVRLLDLLDKHNATATFFTTANFALRYPDLMQRIDQKHEVASHGYFHSSFQNTDLKRSKDTLEQIVKQPVIGYRMARMMPVSDTEIQNAGYTYNSSLHPTFIPGRYNHFDKPRTYFYTDKLLQIPASVTPFVRFPLFWLSFKNFPLWLIKIASRWALQTDGYLNVYYHPWEFAEIKNKEKFGLPFYVSRYAGVALINRLESYMKYLQKYGEFATFKSLIKTI
jgi:peptidoglycan/xylan/chitin deacetylase (PgdA/CDA1 family)